jgi:hypothetical protein
MTANFLPQSLTPEKAVKLTSFVRDFLKDIDGYVAAYGRPPNSLQDAGIQHLERKRLEHQARVNARSVKTPLRSFTTSAVGKEGGMEAEWGEEKEERYLQFTVHGQLGVEEGEDISEQAGDFA